MRTLRSLLAVLVVAAATACTSNPSPGGDMPGQASQEPGVQGASFILEVFNPMPHAMNVAYTVGGSSTTLGSVGANETRRFTLPNRGDDSINLVASDEGQTHSVRKTVDLDKGEVIRWEIRE